MIAVLCAYAEKNQLSASQIFFLSLIHQVSQHDDKNNDNEIQKGGERSSFKWGYSSEEKFFWLWRATNLNSSEPPLTVCAEILCVCPLSDPHAKIIIL